MRKKLISLLLTLVMAVGMVLTMSVTAFAEPAVTIVTVAKGDTVTSICKKYGVDYYTYKKIIMALNCVSDESEFSKIKVGGQFVVPVSEAAAISLSNAAGSVTITGSTGAQTSGSTSTAKEPGLATQIPATDSVGYYIVSYTVESGDTINNIYKSWGLGYKTYTNQILGLNNISGFNKISVGKQLLLPTTVVATGTDVRYTVMKHVMKSGETVYNVVTSGYGLSYSANQEMLKLINGKDNLAAFKVGETLYIPVSGVVSISSDTAATK
jgi:LysM repeat protein